MFCTNLQEQLDSAGNSLSLGKELNWESLLEEEGEILWGIWCIQWVYSLYNAAVLAFVS